MLEKINSPKDLKNLSIKELQIVSNEVSELIIDTIEEHGGHYSSPLGVVDLTVALHHCYDSPNDKLVWDVGHQAYAHKILTGRRDSFKTLRQKDGISGFLKRSESVHDAIGAGHSTTSISSALGIAHARDYNNKDFNVVSIIGDGAMTGGMAYEAMNNLGFHRTQQTIILNDNSKSISASVGALSKYLSKIITNPTYNKIRSDIWDISGKIPVVSDTIRKFLKKSEEGIKGFLTPGILFEELGIRYIGPIDGHDIDEMVKVFNSVREIKTPVLLHVFTRKGIKSSKAEKDSIKYYSLSGTKKDNSVGVSYSEIVGKSLIKADPDNNNFKCITAAMDIGTGIKEFCEKYPDKYIDVGIAESHAVSYASGLSTEGIVPVITIYSTFMQRAYDQIMHDILLQDLPAVFCMDRAGLVGPDGPTHHGVFDISMLNSLPNIVISAPKDGNELSNLIYTGILSGKAFAIRYPKGKCSFYNIGNSQNCIEIGQWEKLEEGSKVALLATGSMVEPCIRIKDEVSQHIGTNVTVVNSRFIKPLDEKMIDSLIEDHEYIFTFEEGSIIGGFGSSVLQYISKKNKSVKVFNKGIKDTFIEHGTRTELLKIAELDDDSLINYIKNNIK
ncbi:MAG: 1-deoxy-D-xylulose-5-phosphate synthase [Candidatus Marinimicrobia bacterium]|nr:1-deoxy-D-xylulose-5-phosphate synthase [Candidatus Neomarinimicrobiota bacterium]|tara:strand:- start:1754 stop:3598 length:1845 start_codon:yes stop_codon:yes gene_type:complete